MFIEGEPLIVRDGADHAIEIRPLLTSQRRRFRQYYAMAARLLRESKGQVDRAYDNNKNFRHCVAVCLELFGLDADNLDLRLIMLLLFSCPGDEPTAPWGNGLLVDWEFPAAAEAADPTEAMEDIDPDLYDLTAIWLADGGSLKEVFDLADKYPHRDLSKIVSIRCNLLEKAQKRKDGKKESELPSPKTIGKDGKIAEMDIEAEMAALKEDMIKRMTGDGEEVDSEWVPVRMAGFGG